MADVIRMILSVDAVFGAYVRLDWLVKGLITQARTNLDQAHNTLLLEGLWCNEAMLNVSK